MYVVFRFRSAFAPVLGVPLAVSLPAEANEGVAVLSDPSRSIGGSITDIVHALGEEGHLVAQNSTRYYPKAALKVPDVGHMRQLSAEGVLSVSPSSILALHGNGAKEAVDVLKKSNRPFVELPDPPTRPRRSRNASGSYSCCRRKTTRSLPWTATQQATVSSSGQCGRGFLRTTSRCPRRRSAASDRRKAKAASHGSRTGSTWIKSGFRERYRAAKARSMHRSSRRPQSTEPFFGPLRACDLYKVRRSYRDVISHLSGDGAVARSRAVLTDTTSANRDRRKGDFYD